MTRPNILWIYCDELRTDAIGCYGNPYTEIKTPNIDSIAEQGVRFDNCFCNSPVCVASRTSILTALYPEETGVYHNEAVWPNYQFDDPPLTFPALFVQHGYATANFGKVHVPQTLDVWQHSDTGGSGMLEFYAGVDRDALQIIRPPGLPTAVGGVYPGDRPYPPERTTDNALAWLAKQIEDETQPFLARISYLQPHTPVFPPPPFDTLYKDAPFPDRAEYNPHLSRFEQRFAEVIGTHEMPARDLYLAHVHYYGLVAWIDDQVGRLLNLLRSTGQIQNTIIVFEADHGASLGECGRFQKQTFTPHSHRVPRLISWPGTLAGGQTRADISESLDLARTFCTLTESQPDPAFRGRDLFTDPPPDAVFSTIGYGFDDSRAFPNLAVGEYGSNTADDERMWQTERQGWPRRSCVRTERYRLDKNMRVNGMPASAEEADIFLADVQADPTEGTNLAGDVNHQAIVAELSALLDQHSADAVEVPQAWTAPDEKMRQRRAEFRFNQR